MKCSTIGSIVFLLTLSIGIFVARQFFYERNPRETSHELVVREKAKTSEPESHPPISPEFKDVRIPEEFQSGDYYHFQPVFEGTASLGRCELDSETKGPWLGLFKHGNRYSLESTKVKFGRPETDDFGTSIPMRFQNSRNALFLISHGPQLKPGPVTTLYLSPSAIEDDLAAPLVTGFRREFTLDQRTYVIRVSSGTTDSGGSASVLVLESNGKRDILYFRSQPYDESIIGNLEWVGDLDGDLRLDLLLSFFDQNGGAQRNILFLSSFAKKGFLVQPYAFFNARFQGC